MPQPPFSFPWLHSQAGHANGVSRTTSFWPGNSWDQQGSPEKSQAHCPAGPRPDLNHHARRERTSSRPRMEGRTGASKPTKNGTGTRVGSEGDPEKTPRTRAMEPGQTNKQTHQAIPTSRPTKPAVRPADVTTQRH